MAFNRTPKTRIVVVVALILALTSFLGSGRHVLATGPRVLTLADMGDFFEAEGGSNDTISGVTYAKGILLAADTGSVTLFTHKFPGYAAFKVAVGVADGSVDDHPGSVEVKVTVDGKPFKTITRTYGQAAYNLTVPFGKASQIKIIVHYTQKKGYYILLGNPTVLTSVPSAGGTGATPSAGGGATTLKLLSASVAAGSQETALITTGANASLTIVINYPDGSQQVLGPKKAGTDGHFAYSWVVPGGMAGVTRVLVDSSGVAQGTFTIK